MLNTLLFTNKETDIENGAFPDWTNDAAILYSPNAAEGLSSFSGTVFTDYDSFMDEAFALGYLDRNDYSEADISMANGTCLLPRWHRIGAEETILFEPLPGYDFASASLDGVLLSGKTFTVPDQIGRASCRERV